MKRLNGLLIATIISSIILLGCQQRASTPQPMAVTPRPTAAPTASAPATPPASSTPGPTSTATAPAEPAALIEHGSRQQPYVALTFDAGESPKAPAGYDATIIQILTETQTPATLFLGGLWMQRYPAQTRQLAANPLFELANHSWSHPDFTRLSAAEMSREIERTQSLLRSLAGEPAALFRFPGGSYNETALAVVDQLGLTPVQWDVVSGDPDPNVSARAMIEAVTGQAQNGSIVVMHMNGRGRHTAQALPQIIRELRRQGYTLVTVSQLLARGR